MSCEKCAHFEPNEYEKGLGTCEFYDYLFYQQTTTECEHKENRT